MRLLEALREHLDEIEAAEPNAHEFVERLLVEYEETGAAPMLSGKQFGWLNDLHARYCS